MVFDGELLVEQLGNQWRQKWVVERLSHLLELDIKAVVDALEFIARKLTKLLPGLDAVVVTAL